MRKPTEKKKKKYICAIYARTSFQEKEEISPYDTIESQLSICKRHIENYKEDNWHLYKRMYIDRNYSGGTPNRPALKQLMNDAKEGKFNMIVFKQIDRLTRNLKDFYELWHFFEEYDIEITSAKEQINTSSPTGRLQIDIITRFAQFEREMAVERTKDSVRFRAKQGQFHGGFLPLGYDLHPTEKGHLIISRKEAKVVKLIFQKYIQIQSAHQVALFCNSKGYRTKQWITKKNTRRGGSKFTKGSMLNLLKNIAYIGKTSDGTNLYNGNWKAILPEATFNRTQKIIESNTQTKTSISQNKYKMLLTGLVQCSHCKSQMTTNYTIKKGDIYLYYKCSSISHGDKHDCKIKSVPARELEGIVIDKIKFLSENKKIVESVINSALKISKNKIPKLQKEQNQINGGLRKIDSRFTPLLQAIEKGKFSMVQDKLQELEEQKTGLEYRLSEVNTELERERLKNISPKAIINNFRHFKTVFDLLPFDKQYELIHLLIKKIVYHENPSKIRIQFYNLPEIETPPNKPKKGSSGGISASRFDKRLYWLPREDSNLGLSG